MTDTAALLARGFTRAYLSDVRFTLAVQAAEDHGRADVLAAAGRAAEAAVKRCDAVLAEGKVRFLDELLSEWEPMEVGRC